VSTVKFHLADCKPGSRQKMRHTNDKFSIDRLANAGGTKGDLQREPIRDDPFHIARRLYHALCIRYPDRFITLFDSNAHVAARSDRPGHA
jgi:hypothetical protein